MMAMVDLLAWVVSPALMAWIVWNYVRIKRAANYVTKEDFKALMRTGQILDLRDPAAFQRKHILGARNFPLGRDKKGKQTFEASLSALRKDKPVLLYDNSRGQAIGRAVLILKKAGFTDVHVLKDGFDYWDGKVK